MKWIKDNNLDHEVFDIIETPPSKEILQKAFIQIESRKLIFNTNGVSYRKLGSSLVNAMSDDEALNALACDGKLVKRPFVITSDGKILLGFKTDIWEEALLA